MPASKKNKNTTTTAASQRKTKKEVEVIDEIIATLVTQLKEQGVKGSVADYIRLLQLREELDGDEVREVKVQWVEEK